MTWIAILFFVNGNPAPATIVDKLRTRADCEAVVRAWEGRNGSGYVRTGRCVRVSGTPR